MPLSLIQGMLAMATAAAALFFLRFWKTTRDRLFLYFALAFLILALHWAALGFLHPPAETRYYLYVPRLIAFLLIIGAIVDKNRSSR